MKAASRQVVDELRSVADPSRRPGMVRVGITIDRALGVSIPNCRRLARRHRGDHALALDLFRGAPLRPGPSRSDLLQAMAA